MERQSREVRTNGETRRRIRAYRQSAPIGNVVRPPLVWAYHRVVALKVSNADRVVFPDVGKTKGEVVAYYERMGARILPHAARRPLSIKRFPKGLAEKGFFQKNVPPHYPPSIARFEVPRNPRPGAERDVTIYPVVSEPEHFAYLANQGAIEIHVPTARIDDVSSPDRVVLDLDPPPGALDLVRRAAVLVREGFREMGLETIPIATGSKGYHLVANVAPASPTLGLTMHKLATLLAAKHPDELTVTFRVAHRGKRVFVDWLRNMPLATLVAPFSLRAHPRATVAVPLDWSEVASTAPDAHSITDLERLLDRPDPLVDAVPQDPGPFEAAVTEAFDASGMELETFDRFRS